MVFTGNYFVAPTTQALTAAKRLMQAKAPEFFRLRRQALKLRWWPGSDGEVSGADLDWDWIEEGTPIGELRIDEIINGHDNLRVIFFKANIPTALESFLRIWLLDVFQKKTQKISRFDKQIWKAQKRLIVQRFYGGSQEA